MKFDFLLSNPSFNIAAENNIAGTGGNTTLYKQTTRRYISFLNENGILGFITLKGIINDLIHKSVYVDKEIHLIHLMDNIDVWDYNTCFFFIENSPRINKPSIEGGFCSKIYSPYINDCFPFVYYSGSNNGMNKSFSETGKNKVIRQLPGRNRDHPVYDFTDKEILAGPKFAFYVLESRKSYTVSDEPIMGGTICYIPTETLNEASKLKLFVENNTAYSNYVRAMNSRGHAFSLRNTRKFNLDQIITGNEIPVEWDIDINEISDKISLEHHRELDHLKETYNQLRYTTSNIVRNTNRIKNTGEIFTPSVLVSYIFDYLEKIRADAFKGSYTFCDPNCGDGQFLSEILLRKLENGMDYEEALSQIYGIDLMKDNINECKIRLDPDNKFKHIIDKNIICANALEYNF